MKDKDKMLQEKGITLIALVVTIIILLILAGVTLNMALSNNGLFKMTRDAAEEYKTAQQDEEDMLTEIEKKLEGYSGNNTPIEQPKPTGPKGKTLVTSFTTLTDKNEKAEDKLGNLITIPKGFKFLEGETVKEGIVIQDKDGNEFVWVPVSNTDGNNNKDSSEGEKEEDLIAIDNSNKIEITLGRYTFDMSNGTPHLEQKGSECKENSHVIEGYYTEYVGQVRTNEGIGAENLQEFVDSVEKNHGYYIARYEAGKSEKDDSKLVSKSGKVWNKVTQEVASSASRAMYQGSESSFKSDLVNSYAWDTAIVYIQTMINENYAYADRGSNTVPMDTGKTGDERCHIYDMAANIGEWTTEYSTYNNNNNTCVPRGGYSGGNHTCTRNSFASIMDDNITFRSLLYLQ